MTEDSSDGAAGEFDLEGALARLGYDEFREGQRRAVETLLRDERLLLVAPTGGGKSLIYQLPALLLPGTTLVISPLVSLMTDQVAALEARGVAATYLAATLEAEELRRRMAAVSDGAYSLVFVAPERLASGGFRSLLRRLDCPLIAVDEAHCISEWGHDFRPEYLQIGKLLAEFPKSRTLACTATATPVVRDEILARLGLPAETPQLVHGFARPNLALRALEVGSQRERSDAVDATLAEALGRPGDDRGCAIVYCPTRKSSEAEAERLAGRGWRAAAYHAGRDGAQRDRVHSAFSSGELEVVVATNAFGMGIDRPDVRAVVHLAPPGSIEAYYQEVGRAGRDGADAIGLLLISSSDMARRRSLLESDAGNDEASRALVEYKWSMFLELMRFAEGGSCRHDAVLRYFGDEEETLAGCGRCDVCERLAAGAEVGEDFPPDEVTLLVRKALSGVARIHGRYGLTAAVQLLRGVSDARLERAGLDGTTTFGILREFREEWLMRLLRRCVTAGWVDFFGGDRPVAVLTESGRAVMMGERAARLLLPPRYERKPPRRGASGPRRTAVEPADVLDADADARFERLRAYRLDVARKAGVPPYVVATDRSLREIAVACPATTEELLDIHGMGPAKVKRYGEGLLSVVRDDGP